MEAYFALWPKCGQDQATPKDTSDVHQAVPVEDFLLKDNDFKYLLPTIVLFIEQELYSNVSMNLDVNFWEIHQENFDKDIHSTTMREEAIKPNGDTFQNSPIHLLFYKKIHNADSELVPNINEKPKLSSMSWCRFKKNSTISLPEGVDELALLLVLEFFTAQFVTKEQYQHLCLF
jgi:hypothetical protein